MKILVACEESQAVTIEFRKRGHEAYSCDTEECSGGHPEWHIQQDVIPLLDGYISFHTTDGGRHECGQKWDMIVAFPPCTYLTNAGASNFYQKWATNEYREKRLKQRERAALFFLEIINSDCKKIAVENPIGYMNTHYRKPDQIVYPWQFGHEVRKPICLWLKGLPPLFSTLLVNKGEMTTWGKKNPKTVSVWYKKETKKGSVANTSKLRSKTFPGIAKAMAEQWG